MTAFDDAVHRERLIDALTDATRAVEDLQRTVQALAELIAQPRTELFRLTDHRPIEERDAPARTIQRDAE